MLDRRELQDALKLMGVRLAEPELDRLFSILDSDGNGYDAHPSLLESWCMRACTHDRTVDMREFTSHLTRPRSGGERPGGPRMRKCTHVHVCVHTSGK